MRHALEFARWATLLSKLKEVSQSGNTCNNNHMYCIGRHELPMACTTNDKCSSSDELCATSLLCLIIIVEWKRVRTFQTLQASKTELWRPTTQSSLYTPVLTHIAPMVRYTNSSPSKGNPGERYCSWFSFSHEAEVYLVILTEVQATCFQRIDPTRRNFSANKPYISFNRSSLQYWRPALRETYQVPAQVLTSIQQVPRSSFNQPGFSKQRIPLNMVVGTSWRSALYLFYTPTLKSSSIGKVSEVKDREYGLNITVITKKIP